MSEQRYEQGMARPEVDIGTGRAERKPAAERTTLVTGGAGFIGGHLVRELLDTGRKVVVLDVRGFTPESRFVIGEQVDSVPLEIASIGDQARVLDVFRKHRPDEVVHAGMILDPAYLATNRSTAFRRCSTRRRTCRPRHAGPFWTPPARAMPPSAPRSRPCSPATRGRETTVAAR